ncbi:hypothetical protein PCANC_12180 [Puccinia coronata f. sp. avenae]|uniref:Uncharacterized protein n=1 Tax=Puccinia coronata f. sp. avenae TaxID=200324 RepID=A0A2N5VGE1_9BASI|nr:hypothetical protein PCANC_12180 [Puccinia coronata f. sp. avenae]
MARGSSQAKTVTLLASPSFGGLLCEAPLARQGSPGPPKRGDCVKLGFHQATTSKLRSFVVMASQNSSLTARKSGSDGCIRVYIGCGHPIQTRARATERIADRFKLGGQTPGPLSLNNLAHPRLNGGTKTNVPTTTRDNKRNKGPGDLMEKES